MNKFNLKIISIDVISETINEHYIPKFYIYFEFNYKHNNPITIIENILNKNLKYTDYTDNIYFSYL